MNLGDTTHPDAPAKRRCLHKLSGLVTDATHFGGEALVRGLHCHGPALRNRPLPSLCSACLPCHIGSSRPHLRGCERVKSSTRSLGRTHTWDQSHAAPSPSPL